MHHGVKGFPKRHQAMIAIPHRVGWEPFVHSRVAIVAVFDSKRKHFPKHPIFKTDFDREFMNDRTEDVFREIGGPIEPVAEAH